MKRKMFLICGLIFLLMAGCQQTQRSFVEVKKPTPLINKMRSYEDIDTVKRFLSSRSYDWKVIEKSGLSLDDKRPPFDILIIEIPDYSHLGYGGRLRLEFFNNRLMNTTFYPEKPVLYRRVLQKTEGIQFNENKDARIDPFTRILMRSTPNGETFIRWEDKRLKEEAKTWIKNYS